MAVGDGPSGSPHGRGSYPGPVRDTHRTSNGACSYQPWKYTVSSVVSGPVFTRTDRLFQLPWPDQVEAFSPAAPVTPTKANGPRTVAWSR